MGSLAGNGEPPEEEKRWGHVLEEVVEEQQKGRPWWQNVGIFFAWAGGFAGVAALLVTLLLLIVELFSKGRQFTVRTLSDWLFWASAMLMIVGLLAPSAAELEKSSGKQQEEERSSERRTTKALRRRIRRVYDPWRWRLWAAALLAFGISALVGLLARP